MQFEQPAQEATLLDYLHEVEHAAERIERLERAIDEAVQTAPAPMRAVIEALQALRGIALVSAVTIVAEVGELSRFARAPQLMGYSGMGAREDSSGDANAARRDHEDRATRISGASSSRRPGRIGIGRRSARALRKRQASAERGGEGDRLEGAAPIARAATGGSWAGANASSRS